MRVLSGVVILFCALGSLINPAAAQKTPPDSKVSPTDSSANVSQISLASVEVNLQKASQKTADPGVSGQPALVGTGLLQYHVPFSVLFKYDTTWNNPDHRCYEIRKPISGSTTFLFNFLDNRQYNVAALPK